MAHAKITNGAVDAFPYSIGQLRRDNPNTSFPRQIPSEILASYGVHPVSYADQPTVDERTQRAEQETTPVLRDGAWTLGWAVVAKTAAEILEYDDNAAQGVRSERNARLSASDWTQVADAPVDQAAWATYRQALRDITAQAGFPHSVDWPVKPE